jgi:acylphosphatase
MPIASSGSLMMIIRAGTLTRATLITDWKRMETKRTVHVIIFGRVHGVGFRAWTRYQAELRGLEGWVRNRRDGSVEAVFSGPAEEVEAMLSACQDGPRGAKVERLDTVTRDPADIAPLGSGRFEILGTV